MRCPKCSSENVQVHYETEKKGFSGGKGCCGWLIFGPIGLLCGLCGKDEVKSEKKYWVCNNCGAKFTDAEAENAEYARECNNAIQSIVNNAESNLSTHPEYSILLQRKTNIINIIKSYFSNDALKQFVFLNIENEQPNSLFYSSVIKFYNENIALDLSKDCVYFIYRNGLHGYIFTNSGIYYDDKFFIPSSNIKNISVKDTYLQINNPDSSINLDFHHIAKNQDALAIIENIIKQLYIEPAGGTIEEL